VSPDPDLPMTEAQAQEEFRETARALKVLLEEMSFRQRGNNVLRTALAFILIFGTTVFSSSAVSYCITAQVAPGWCAMVPGSAIDTRTSFELRIAKLEDRVAQLEKEAGNK
jgi:hypothetical protein